MKITCLALSLAIFTRTASSLFWGSFGFGTGITYQLYTRLNPVNGQPLTYANWYSLAASNFDNSKPTRWVHSSSSNQSSEIFFSIIIHGFLQSGRSVISRDLKNSYLARGDFNVIVSDWSSVSSPYYHYARYRVGTTGIAVSKFIEWLGVAYGTLHLVGYDLGAHVAGIAGKNSVRGRIHRIIGLDPSLPLFNENASRYRLSVGDAALVEVFHSNGGQLGIFTRIGDIDYYINDGRNQPECAG